jgi:enterochelin esterase-like enzyme
MTRICLTRGATARGGTGRFAVVPRADSSQNPIAATNRGAVARYARVVPHQIRNTRVTFTAPDHATALIGDFTDGTDRPIPLNAGESVTLEFPKRAFIEYAFLDAHGKPFADPDNPVHAQNPWYSYGRAAILEGFAPHPLRDPLNEAPAGKTESISWTGGVFPGTRRAYVHLPATLEPDRTYPVFYVQDGVAYRRTGKLGAVHDNLVHLGRIEPAIFVFLEPADRTQEYFLNPAYPEFLLTEAIPEIERRYPVATHAAGRGLWGASLGGLIGMYTALEHSDQFSRVVTQSGAFQGTPGTPYARGGPEWLLERFSGQARLPLRISMDCGQLEWLLGANRRFAGMLFDRAYPHRYAERASGHNWVTWRDGLVDHLEYMLG